MLADGGGNESGEGVRGERVVRCGLGLVAVKNRKDSNPCLRV